MHFYSFVVNRPTTTINVRCAILFSNGEKMESTCRLHFPCRMLHWLWRLPASIRFRFSVAFVMYYCLDYTKTSKLCIQNDTTTQINIFPWIDVQKAGTHSHVHILNSLIKRTFLYESTYTIVSIYSYSSIRSAQQTTYTIQQTRNQSFSIIFFLSSFYLHTAWCSLDTAIFSSGSWGIFVSAHQTTRQRAFTYQRNRNQSSFYLPRSC